MCGRSSVPLDPSDEDKTVPVEQSHRDDTAVHWQAASGAETVAMPGV